MRKSQGLVVTPKQSGVLQIPKPLIESLSHLIGGLVAVYASLGHPEANRNRRAQFPAAIILSELTPNSEERHHVSTFVPHGQSVRPILGTKQNLEVSDGGVMLLPPSVLALFQRENIRARVLLLTGKHGATHGFAVSFQDRFSMNHK